MMTSVKGCLDSVVRRVMCLSWYPEKPLLSNSKTNPASAPGCTGSRSKSTVVHPQLVAADDRSRYAATNPCG